MVLDPRDHGAPSHKEWEEFRATFASQRLLGWLILEIDAVLPEYFGDLQERFWNAFHNAGSFPRPDGKVPLFSHDYESETPLEPHEAKELYEQLFPHEDESGGDVRYWGLAAVVIGLHLALEGYTRALGGDMRRNPTSKAVRKLLQGAPTPTDLKPDDLNALVDLEATRNLLVHQRGVVDDDYIRNVSGAKLLHGELRPLDGPVLERFANAVWNAAALLRDSGVVADR